MFVPIVDKPYISTEHEKLRDHYIVQHTYKNVRQN